MDPNINENTPPSAHLLQDQNSPKPAFLVQSDKADSVVGFSSQNAQPGTRQWTWFAYNGVVATTVALPLLGLIVWLALRGTKIDFKSFGGEKIGGRLTQAQAKALDAVCGAIFAPLIMATLNYYWFGSARVSVVNEHHPKSSQGVPLSALVAASTSTGGTYDVFHFWALLQGKSWRLGLLISLILLSALGKSSLSNVIAYEAYSVDTLSDEKHTLRYLRDLQIEIPQMTATTDMDVFGFNEKQQSDAANQLTGLLTGLVFENATSKLNDSAYIGINSTSKAIDSLPASVVSLLDVPGYRLSVECEPAKLENFGVTKMGGYMALISGSDAATHDLLQAWVPGQADELKSSYNEVFDIAAFTLNHSYVYLGSLTSFNHTKDSVSSAFGPIQPTAFNMSLQGFQGTKSTMSAWGVRCNLNRQSGLLNVTRLPHRSPFITSTAFEDEKQVVPSLLAAWQVNLNYHAPLSPIAGLGPPLTNSALNKSYIGETKYRLDFGTFAQNYLYASAEAQRIMHEVAASNASRDQPEYFYDFDASVSTQYYRITYVPVVLLIGLLSVLLAALVTEALMLGAAGSLSAKTFRQVDATRLVVDCVAGLREEGQGVARLGSAPNEEIARWAGAYRVVYEKVDENEDGNVVVRLRTVGGGTRSGDAGC